MADCPAYGFGADSSLRGGEADEAIQGCASGSKLLRLQLAMTKQHKSFASRVGISRQEGLGGFMRGRHVRRLCRPSRWPRRLFPRGFTKLNRTQRLAGIEADGAANPQVVHDVEAAFTAFQLRSLRLIGSQRAGQTHCVMSAAFQWRWSIARMAWYSRSNFRDSRMSTSEVGARSDGFRSAQPSLRAAKLKNDVSVILVPEGY
jgi:hypothetical protein